MLRAATACENADAIFFRGRPAPRYASGRGVSISTPDSPGWGRKPGTVPIFPHIFHIYLFVLPIFVCDGASLARHGSFSVSSFPAFTSSLRPGSAPLTISHPIME